jgi:hypothetical protein
MAKGREAVDFHQSNCKKSKSVASQPFTLRPKSKGHCNLKCLLFDKGDGLSKEVWVGREWRPKLWSRGRRFFSWKNQSLARSSPLDWRGCFGQGIKWDIPLGLDFGLYLWRLHTMPGRRLHFLYFIDYFQPISLDSQQSLETQSHSLLTWTVIVWSGLKTYHTSWKSSNLNKLTLLANPSFNVQFLFSSI